LPFVGLAAHLPAGRAPPGLEKRLCMATAAVPGRAGDLGDPTVRPALALVAPGSAPPCAPLAVSSQVHSTWFLDFLTQDLDLGRDRIIIFFFSLDPGKLTFEFNKIIGTPDRRGFSRVLGKKP
uniref:Uncharacterized protein n=2 Tax=Canis lupus familiaris TaxID=9615 RepID=A0A8P0P351_CANLF